MAQRNCIFIVRPHVSPNSEDASQQPSFRRRLRVGTDPKAIPLCGDFNVRRITPAEAEDLFSDEHLRSKHKARGASKKLIELLAAGTDIPRRRTHVNEGGGESLSPSRLPTSLLELAKHTAAAAAAEAAAAALTTNNSSSSQPPAELDAGDLSEYTERPKHNTEQDGSNKDKKKSASARDSNTEAPDLGSPSILNSGAAATAAKLNASLDASLAEYDRPRAGMIALRCAPTQNKNFFRESYSHDYHVVAATNTDFTPECCLYAPCPAVEKCILDLYKKHMIAHCKSLWDAEDATVVLQCPDSATLHPAPSQIVSSLVFPEVPNAKEFDGLPGARRQSMSRRGSMRMSRSNSLRGPSGMSGLDAITAFTLAHQQAQQQQQHSSSGLPRTNSGGSARNNSGNDESLPPPPPPFPHEKHLLRFVLEDLLDERKQRAFPGIYVDIFVSAVMIEEPEDDAAQRKFETNSAASASAKSGGVKINVEDLLSGSSRTNRYVGDWAGGIKDLEAVQAAAAQMQALPDAPSVEKMREECKVLQMLRALDDSDAEKLIEEFKKFDQDGNGVLDPTEIREFFMEAFGYWIVDDELESFFKVADQDNSGTIDIPEFLALFEGQRPKRGPGEGRSLKPPSSKLVDGLKALARIKRVKRADELSMRPPTLTVSQNKPGSGAGAAASSSSGGGGGPSSSARSECKILSMLHALDDHDADKLIQEFKKFDADGNSELDRTEVREFFMEAFSYWVTEEEMDQFFKVADTDNSGTIDIPEFLALFEHKRDKRAFTAKPVGPPGASMVSSKIKSGLDALARIKRVRQNLTTLQATATAVGKAGAARNRSGSLTSISGDFARRPSSLLSGPKIAYRHTNSTNPFDVGIFGMRMLQVTSSDDIDWLERRLAAQYQKAYHGDENFSTTRTRGHWVINITLRQAYDQSVSGLAAPSRSGTMRFMLMNASQKRMAQLNFELRRMLHSTPRTIYDKFPPDVDAQLQLDSLDSRGRMKKSVLNMVHVLRAALHQRKISRLLSFVVSNEQQVNPSLAILGNLMRTGIETTNLAYDKAVEDALIHLVALRMQLEKERNDAHFAVEAFEEIKKAKHAAFHDISVELQKQLNSVYRQLKREEVASENMKREQEHALAAAAASSGSPERQQQQQLGRARSVIFLASPMMSPRSSRGSPRSRGSAFEGRDGGGDSNNNDSPAGSLNSTLRNNNYPDSLTSTSSPSNREIALTSAILHEREKADKADAVRQQQLNDVQSVLNRARDRYRRAQRNVATLQTELPRKKAHYEFLMANSRAEWKEEEERMESSKRDQLKEWKSANIEQRDAMFALSILPDVPDETAVLDSVNRQAAAHRRRGFEQQLRKCEELRRNHLARLADAKRALAGLQRVADAISGRAASSDAAQTWEDSDTSSMMMFDDDNNQDQISFDSFIDRQFGRVESNNDEALQQQQQQQRKPQQQQHRHKYAGNPAFREDQLVDDDDDDEVHDADDGNSHINVSPPNRFGGGASPSAKRNNNNQQQHQHQQRNKPKEFHLPPKIRALEFTNRRKLFGQTALLFEASTLLFRVLERCRTQNEEMAIKFERGDFHEAEVRNANRTLVVQPPQTMLVALLKTPPTVLQSVLRDAINGAYAALHQLGSTFGRNAALFQADALKTDINSPLLADPSTARPVTVSVAPLQLSAEMQRALQLVALVRNDPSVKMSLGADDAESLEKLSFALASVDSERAEREQRELQDEKSARRGFALRGMGPGVGGGVAMTPRRPATARLQSGRAASALSGGGASVRSPRKPTTTATATAAAGSSTARNATPVGMWGRPVVAAGRK